MYERFFGLTARPFMLTPDPRFLFPSRQHSMALTLLEYGLESRAAFTVMTGDIGSGKTMLVRRLLRDMAGDLAVGLISNSHSSFTSIYPWALSALAIVPAGDGDVAAYEALVDTFVRIYASGRRTLLVVDEAQNLSPQVLEELRLLSNVNSESELVLQILLVGQPELRQTLGAPGLAQLAQRISVDYHLAALARTDTHAYVSHRLVAAGGSGDTFSTDALEAVHDHSRGVPRLINQLCDMALVYGFASGQRLIDRALISQLIGDLTAGAGAPLFLGHARPASVAASGA